MKYNASIRKLSEIKSDITCIFSFQKSALGQQASDLDTATNQSLSKSIKNLGFKSELGSSITITSLDANSKQIIIVGLGEQKALNKASILKAAASATKDILAHTPKTITLGISDLAEHTAEAAEAFSSSIASASYRFETYKSEKSKKPTPTQLTFVCDKKEQNGVKKALGYSQAKSIGMALTRDLGNEPGNVATPSYLAKVAKEMAKEFNSLSCKVLEEKDMEKLNMGAFLSVSKGSTEPGKLIVLEYKGGAAKSAPHVLVGKGITFDTGGISLKPGQAMDEMKYDMCGAASVLGTMRAIAELAPKKNIIGVIAAAENMPAGNASKPGDIVTTASGQTVEILNTDAEGRLVLCDALTYVEKFKPKSVIDIATLTGACIIALGHSTSAVMSNNDEFAETLLQCGQEANDKAWQLPIWDEYHKQLDSPFADMQNIGGKGAGSITAACFLSKFAKKYTWAHLDIAGTAWTSGANKGATGRPVPLLLNYLMNHAK
ncbi:leucyl aminopeptidase [Oleiphilus sp. HI0125]|uniref:leucyl aminopeptidase n=1 Tax=Oleiphilus sp. HI0125 TaxID=1822266 RepID=UPI0007C3DB37|nr:leucyl aminopeptidase [Oleiphilus sp. HI0125]KZZ55689.1 leucyl aminopeptidase [Oleiphilus sp. HI0125]KZZ59616.1 leucyl aminopeptidase [Oleiphilus sp. HI0125]